VILQGYASQKVELLIWELGISYFLDSGPIREIFQCAEWGELTVYDCGHGSFGIGERVGCDTHDEKGCGGV
jgi:hypothetical protein